MIEDLADGARLTSLNLPYDYGHGQANEPDDLEGVYITVDDVHGIQLAQPDEDEDERAQDDDEADER